MVFKKPYFIIVNGYPGSGKSTFEMFVRDHQDIRVGIESIINPVKSAAKELGWDGTKTSETRNFLADLLILTISYFPDSYFDWFTRKIINSVYASGYDIVFIDCRNPKNIEILKSKLENYGQVITLLISRTNIFDLDNITSEDENIRDYSYNYIIYNNGTLEDLRQRAKKFVEKIKYDANCT